MKTVLQRLDAERDACDHHLRMIELHAEGENEKELLLAGCILDQSPITLEQFSVAVSALCWAAEHKEQWSAPVEDAFRRLTRKDQKSARRDLIYFFGIAGKHDQVLMFAPKKVENLVDIAFVFTALVETG